MLAFVIPFKPKRNSKNWECDGTYLKNTLMSVLNQTCESFHVFVVVSDMPFNNVTHPKIDYLKLPGKYCTFDEIQDGNDELVANTFYKERDVEYLFDQGRKQMYGAAMAKSRGFDYVMCVDADDLVSNNIAAYVERHKNTEIMGWFVNKGYYFIAKDCVFIRQPYSMNMMNGSTHIVHRNYIPDFHTEELNVKSTNFFSNHPYLPARLKTQFGKELQPLPFYAVIYLISNLNWWTTVDKLKGQSLIQRFKFHFRKVLFTKGIRRNFFING